MQSRPASAELYRRQGQLTAGYKSLALLQRQQRIELRHQALLVEFEASMAATASALEMLAVARASAWEEHKQQVFEMEHAPDIKFANTLERRALRRALQHAEGEHSKAYFKAADGRPASAASPWGAIRIAEATRDASRAARPHSGAASRVTRMVQWQRPSSSPAGLPPLGRSCVAASATPPAHARTPASAPLPAKPSKERPCSAAVSASSGYVTRPSSASAHGDHTRYWEVLYTAASRASSASSRRRTPPPPPPAAVVPGAGSCSTVAAWDSSSDSELSNDESGLPPQETPQLGGVRSRVDEGSLDLATAVHEVKRTMRHQGVICADRFVIETDRELRRGHRRLADLRTDSRLPAAHDISELSGSRGTSPKAVGGSHSLTRGQRIARRATAAAHLSLARLVNEHLTPAATDTVSPLETPRLPVLDSRPLCTVASAGISRTIPEETHDEQVDQLSLRSDVDPETSTQKNGTRTGTLTDVDASVSPEESQCRRRQELASLRAKLQGLEAEYVASQDANPHRVPAVAVAAWNNPDNERLKLTVEEQWHAKQLDRMSSSIEALSQSFLEPEVVLPGHSGAVHDAVQNRDAARALVNRFRALHYAAEGSEDNNTTLAAAMRAKLERERHGVDLDEVRVELLARPMIAQILADNNSASPLRS